jgi:hypothetical protein
MSIRISSSTPEDEPGSTLLPARDRIDEDLRTHPAVRLASEAVPLMHRTTAGVRFGPVRLIERDSVSPSCSPEIRPVGRFLFSQAAIHRRHLSSSGYPIPALDSVARFERRTWRG